MADEKKRILVFQPAFPDYRRDFFDRLELRYGKNFRLYHFLDEDLVSIQAEQQPPYASALSADSNISRAVEILKIILTTNLNHKDTVVICGAPRELTTYIFIIARFFVGFRLIWWGQFFGANYSRARNFFKLFLMTLCDNALVYTPYERDTIAKQFSRCSNKIHSIGNGLDQKKIDKLFVRKSSANGNFNILFIGRGTVKSQLNILLEATKYLDEDIVVNIVGESAPKPVSGQGSKVVFHGVLTEETDIANIANSCDIFVYPGAVGLSLFHAFGYRLPAIIHDNFHHHMPEARAFVVGKSGFQFKEGDMKSLVSAIHEAKESRKRLRVMGTFNYSLIKDTYSTEKMFDNISRVITI